MNRESLADIAYLLLFVLFGAVGGWFAGRYYERRNTPPATIYVNRFDCSKEGAEDAERLKEEILRRQREVGR